MKNEVILILVRRTNTLWIAVNGSFVSGIEKVTGVHKTTRDNRTYGILSKREFIGLIHDVVYVGEEW